MVKPSWIFENYIKNVCVDLIPIPLIAAIQGHSVGAELCLCGLGYSRHLMYFTLRCQKSGQSSCSSYWTQDKKLKMKRKTWAE